MASDPKAVMEKVKQVALLAGLKFRDWKDGAELAVPMDMGDGRSQVVFIAHIGELGGLDVVEFRAPCQRLKKGFLNGLGKNDAIDLLRRNARLLVGHFSLYSFENEELLMVCSPQIVDTMEVEEFNAHIRACCAIADAYEKEHGVDEF